MLQYSPCLDIFFKDLPFDRRIEKAALIGYSFFEFWTWWDKDLAAARKAMEERDIACAAMCTKFVSLTDPARRGAYLEGLAETLAAARELGTRVIISQVGDELAGVERKAQRASIAEGLKAAAELLERAGLVLAIEPLNTRYDHKGYYLERTDEAAEIVNAVGSPKVGILYDVYHQQISEGNLINTITDYFPLIRHIHIADHPGRHEIGSGEINYRNVLGKLEELGYEGRVGIELFPLDESHERVLSDPLFMGKHQARGLP